MVALIGIDCATQPGKVGLALGELDHGVVRVSACRTGSPSEEPAWIVRGWLEHCGTALLALDAPLGWPRAMGASLHRHQAGEGMGAAAHELFRRQTDDAICQRFRKRPLEVGANFISRTAVAALNLLEQLRFATGAVIPLAWSPADLTQTAAIEVYPAATRLAHGSKAKGGSIEGLEPLLDLGALDGGLPASADAIDALVCLIAAADFLEGRARPPRDLAAAQQEGWIWTAEAAHQGRGVRPAAALQPTWEPSKAPSGMAQARPSSRDMA